MIQSKVQQKYFLFVVDVFDFIHFQVIGYDSSVRYFIFNFTFSSFIKVIVIMNKEIDTTKIQYNVKLFKYCYFLMKIKNSPLIISSPLKSVIFLLLEEKWFTLACCMYSTSSRVRDFSSYLFHCCEQENGYSRLDFQKLFEGFLF